MPVLKVVQERSPSLPQAEVECPLPRILFIFDLKMASFAVFLMVFYAI